MLTTSDLIAKYGMSNRQVRHRLTALRQVCPPELILTGQHGETVLVNAAVDLFDRVVQLEQDGLSVAAAVEQLSADGAVQSSNAHGKGPSEAVALASPAVEPPSGELLQALERLEDMKERIEELKADKAELQAQVRAMLPPSKDAEHQTDTSGSKLPMSKRWRALFTGKV